MKSQPIDFIQSPTWRGKSKENDELNTFSLVFTEIFFMVAQSWPIFSEFSNVQLVIGLNVLQSSLHKVKGTYHSRNVFALGVYIPQKCTCTSDIRISACSISAWWRGVSSPLRTVVTHLTGVRLRWLKFRRKAFYFRKRLPTFFFFDRCDGFYFMKFLEPCPIEHYELEFN